MDNRNKTTYKKTMCQFSGAYLEWALGAYHPDGLWALLLLLAQLWIPLGWPAGEGVLATC